MTNKDFRKIQIIIAIVAVIYIVMPDLFVGPIDDATIMTIAVIVETVVGVMRVLTNKETVFIRDNNEEN